tara:strand:- start:155 stop:415 length:261 start_codon:yes stop_codon:yes gene_type:complete
MMMIDLHGERHENVDRVVENFLLLSTLPCKVITGNSDKMKELVINVVERHELRWEYDVPNYGCIIISEGIKQQIKQIEKALYRGEG